MKPTFTDLTPEQQLSYGNGCSYVFDFIFTASCQQHDFNFARGGGLHDWAKANWDMFTHMWSDSSRLWHYVVSLTYFIGLMILSLPFFYWTTIWKGNYNSIREILTIDRLNKVVL
jgi:hypothetical protein